MGRIYVIMGKSASGKDHIYQKVKEDGSPGLKELILYTTRPKREGEVNGREYYFTDEDHLEALRKEGRIIEERVYDTVYGPWYYFTADEGQIQTDSFDYITIGTLESYVKMKNYFAEGILCPLYIEVEDGERLLRAIKREQKQKEPQYAEMCRRFLADAEDFSEERIREAGIDKRFSNDGAIEDCINEIKDHIRGLK